MMVGVVVTLVVYWGGGGGRQGWSFLFYFVSGPQLRK